MPDTRFHRRGSAVFGSDCESCAVGPVFHLLAAGHDVYRKAPRTRAVASGRAKTRREPVGLMSVESRSYDILDPVSGQILFNRESAWIDFLPDWAAPL